jgi:hypothetical protein
MESTGVIRHVFRRLLLSFGVPPPDQVWYRRFFPLIALLITLAGGIVAWTAGTSALVGYINAITGTPVDKPIGIGVRTALVVAWIATLGALICLANIVIPSCRDKPLVIVVPETLYSWLTGMTAIAVGLLIGTSIFR